MIACGGCRPSDFLDQYHFSRLKQATHDIARNMLRTET